MQLFWTFERHNGTAETRQVVYCWHHSLCVRPLDCRRGKPAVHNRPHRSQIVKIQIRTIPRIRVNPENSTSSHPKCLIFIATASVNLPSISRRFSEQNITYNSCFLFFLIEAIPLCFTESCILYSCWISTPPYPFPILTLSAWSPNYKM